MSDYQSPGVHIEETNSLGTSVVAVETAVPAFVGFTEKADRDGTNLLNIPTRVDSLLEYTRYYGEGAQSRITVKLRAGGTYSSSDVRYELPFQMYHAVRMHFTNGGGPLWIVSVGAFTNGLNAYPNPEPLKSGIAVLERVPTVTLIYLPDMAGAADSAGRYEPAVAALDQCGMLMDRFLVMDVPFGDEAEFYAKTIGNDLDRGAAYTPDIFSTISLPVPDNYIQFVKGDSNTDPARDALVALGTLDKVRASGDPQVKEIRTEGWLAGLSTALAPYMYALVHPGGAVMGAICQTDRSRGVWNAPANVALNGVSGPLINLTNEQQMGLNAPANGKAINVIRQFVGRGTIIWGSRTMDANSLDWRYIQVRRTVIYIEQSLKNALEHFVFAPNNENTWTSVRSMCEGFLADVWKSGGLMGATQAEAFAVACGVGTTMTQDDILNGKLVLSVMLQLTRPAEFITITLSQSMLS